MRAWPRFRERVILFWHGVLDHDRKIPRRRREETAARRADAKALRLRRDEVWTQIQHRRASERKASEQTQVIIPEIMSSRPSVRSEPQVIYVSQQPQKVVVKSMGCADGCVIVIAILIGIAVLMGGCTVMGFGAATKAIIDSKERARNAEPSNEAEESTEIP